MAEGMSSSEDNCASHSRRNPRRICRPIVEVLAKSYKPGSADKVSILPSKGTSNSQDLHLAKSRGLRKTRNEKQKPQAVNQSACPDLSGCLQNSTHQVRSNGHVSSNLCEAELNKCTVPKCPAKTSTRSRKGRTKADVQPCEKGDVVTSNDVAGNKACSDTLDNSEHKAKGESHKSAQTKQKRSRYSKKIKTHRTPSNVSTGLRACTTLSLCNRKRKSPCHSNNNCSSRPSTPKRAKLRPSPLLSSTPNSGIKSLSAAENSCSPCTPDQNIAQSSPVKTPSLDVTPSRRVKPQRLAAAGRPRGRKKRNVQEKPSASGPLKRRRKSKTLLTESPQEEPSVEMFPSSRPCLETQVPEPQDMDHTMSSDLSIELSLQEEVQPLYPSLQEEEEDQDNEEEELPSFLQQDNNKPLSISEGLCVWCKLRKYPYWPAVVKSVNHKSKKASIVFIDDSLTDQKRRGFFVSLRTLKPFDCEESEKLVNIAKEKYGTAITWSLELISDYRIRIGCGSFAGSLIEYCAADISCPVRRKFSEGTYVLTFPSQEMLSEQCHNSDDNTEDIIVEEQDELLSKKVLPDRAKAARNRANEKLVDFIVNRRGVKNRLLAVISGRETSQWMQALRKPTRRVVDVYLEDEKQIDKVYRYLEEVCDSSPHINSCLENIRLENAQADRISLILDALLPEAIIHAIAGVHKLSLEKAKEKYRSGPCFSKRERQEFDMMIEKQMKVKEIKLRHKQ